MSFSSLGFCGVLQADIILGHRFHGEIMPVKVDITPPPPANSKQPGVTKSLLYNGSKFQGHQKSKGNSYEVEVVLQVSRQ